MGVKSFVSGWKYRSRCLRELKRRFGFRSMIVFLRGLCFGERFYLGKREAESRDRKYGKEVGNCRVLEVGRGV